MERKREEISVEVGLHQGLARSPFLFVVVIDVLTTEIKIEKTDRNR